MFSRANLFFVEPHYYLHFPFFCFFIIQNLSPGSSPRLSLSRHPNVALASVSVPFCSLVPVAYLSADACPFFFSRQGYFTCIGKNLLHLARQISSSKCGSFSATTSTFSDHLNNWILAPSTINSDHLAPDPALLVNRAPVSLQERAMLGILRYAVVCFNFPHFLTISQGAFVLLFSAAHRQTLPFLPSIARTNLLTKTMPPPFTTLPLVTREPPTSPTTPPSSSMSLASLLSILLSLLMLLLAIITLGVYKYVGWRRGKKLDKAVEKHAREVEQRRKLAKIRYAYGIPGMYGSGYDGDRGISGPPVGWCECCLFLSLVYLFVS